MANTPLPTHPPIVFWDRRTKRLTEEAVYGDFFIRAMYGHRLGRFVMDRFLSRPWFSRLYGFLQSTAWSRFKVAPFVRKFAIPMDDYVSESYSNFNDFFIRRFRPGARPFATSPTLMPAFAEARYFAYSAIGPLEKFPVKGIALSIDALLGSSAKARPFMGGPLLLARLCPTDYHRFHFPDAGTVIDAYRIPGKLHSVNPLALHFKNDIFLTNERFVTVLQTQNFGRLAYIEVGATCVGRIIHTHSDGPFSRGEEKGYFLFGGSTVILVGEPGRWLPSSDLLEQTWVGVETLVRLGDVVGSV